MKILSDLEIKEIYKEYNTPKHVILHCIAVSEAAVRITEALNEKGYNFNVKLVRVAGLIHDSARVKFDHGGVIADKMESLGCYELADVVRTHMYYELNDIKHIAEIDLMCLGDRLVKENIYVGLDERIDYIIEKAIKAKEENRISQILESKRTTQILLDEIGKIIGKPVDDLFKIGEEFGLNYKLQ